MNFWQNVRQRASKFIAPKTAEYVVLDPNGTTKASDKAPYSMQVGTFSAQSQTWSNKFEVYAKEGFETNPIVHAGITYKANAAAMVQRRVYTGEMTEPNWVDSNDPINILLREPNEFMSGIQLRILETIFYNLAGNSYTFIERDENNEDAIGLWPMRPDRVAIIEEKGKFIGYAYRTGRGARDFLPILPKDMIHVKKVNPLDPLEGLGEGLPPLTAAAYDGDVSNKLSSFLKNFVDNGIMPAAILTHDGVLQKSKRDAIKRQWNEQYGGVQNWGEVAVLDNRVSYQRVSLLLSEIQMDHIDKRAELHLCAVIGIHPYLIPTIAGSENSLFNSGGGFEGARRAFWEDTMLLDLRMFAEAYSQKVLHDDSGRNIAHDISQIPAFRINIGERSTAAKTLYDMGMPAQQAISQVGIEAQEFEGGDIPFGGQKLFAAAMRPEPETDNEDTDNEDSEDEESTLRLNAPIDERRLEYIREQFKFDARAIHEIVENVTKVAAQEQRSWRWNEIGAEIEAYYDSIAVGPWMAVMPNYHVAIRKHCADILAIGTLVMDRENWKLKRGRNALTATLRKWSEVWARELVAKEAEADILYQDGDLIIDTDDVDIAITEAADVDKDLEGMLNATTVDNI